MTIWDGILSRLLREHVNKVLYNYVNNGIFIFTVSLKERDAKVSIIRLPVLFLHSLLQ